MPGTMFITSTELNSLPVSGTPWTRVAAVAGADAGTPNLGNIDSIVQSKVLVQALTYVRNGSGVGRSAISAKILAVIGTESSTSQPLNPWRQIADWIAAADLIDLVDTGFDNWVRTLADKVVPGQTNWNTLRKCARDSGNNWGSYARPSLFAVGAWLKRRGLTTSGGQTGQSLMDEVAGYFKQWTGETKALFAPSGAFSSSWSNGYPSSGGVINTGTSTGGLGGANAEDASRGGSGPPLTGSGTSYSMEALDGALMMAILLHHAGTTAVWSWGNSAIRRNGEQIGSSNFSGSNHIYHHEPSLINWVYGTSLTVPANDSYGGRMVPFCTDWFASSGSQFLKTAITGGGTTAPAVTPPVAAFTTSVSAQTVSLNATATTAGSSAITSLTINWGDGSAVQTLVGATRTATHVYSTTAGATYTITLTAITADASNTVTHTVNVSGSDGAPFVAFDITPARGTAPLTVTGSWAGSFDPNGDTMTGTVNWGDGTTVTGIAVSAVSPATVSHTYADTGVQANYTVTARITSTTLTSAPDVTTVTVDAAASAAIYGKLYIAIGGQLYPINPNEILSLAAGAPIPTGTLPGTVIYRTS